MNAREDVISKLEKYYNDDDSRVSGSNFRCSYRECCQEIMTKKKTQRKIPLYQGRAAFVGSRYGARPKIVVVAQDAGDTPHESTVSVRDEMDIRCAIIEKEELERDIKYHMKGTSHFVKTMLGISPDDVNAVGLPYCAIVNAAKCSRQCCSTAVADKLYDKCADYLRREIEILAPDAIWIQGAKAFISFRDEDAYCSNSYKEELKKEGIVILKYMTHGREIRAMKTNHPSARFGNQPKFRSTAHSYAADWVMGGI